jgi:hypothetical protein
MLDRRYDFTNSEFNICRLSGIFAYEFEIQIQKRKYLANISV